jgi:glycosyltransferase involved in cell wall biosynthesis
MAFDLNHEIYNADLRKRILSNLKITHSIVVDCEFSRSSLIDHGYTKRVDVIPFGCNQDIWKPIENRNYSKANFISTRSWTEIHNNQLLVEAISKSTLLQQ